MNRTHLGDALDFWKGRIIGCLLAADLLHEPRAVLMPTDWPWRQAGVLAYARFLRLPSGEHVVGLERFTHQGREAYFEQIAQLHGDIFLDPDTGIARANPSEKHVTVDELDQLACSDESRIMLVYQHRLRETDYIQDYLGRLAARGFACFAYDGGVVSMFFISRSEQRAQAVAEHLMGRLRPATHRVVRP